MEEKQNNENLIKSKRLLLLLNGGVIGIFELISNSIVFIILSFDGKYVKIISQEISQIHLTKYTPNQFLQFIILTIEFRNNYLINVPPFVCSRFYGQIHLTNQISLQTSNNSSNIIYCPFLQRVCFNIPVIFQDESPCGLINTFDTFYTFIRRISPSSPHQKLPTLINITLNNEIYNETGKNSQNISMSNTLEFFEEISQELSLLWNNFNYFPSTYIVSLELLDDILYINNINNNNVNNNNSSFQIWFDLSLIPTSSSFSNNSENNSEMKWEEGEIITLQNETFMHQIHQKSFKKSNIDIDINNSNSFLEENNTDHDDNDDNTTISGDTYFKKIKHSYHLSILEFDNYMSEYENNTQLNSSLNLFLKRKSNMIHLLAFRDHFYQLQSNNINCQNQNQCHNHNLSISQKSYISLSPSPSPSSPITTNSSSNSHDLVDSNGIIKIPTIIKSIRIDNGKSGLYILSDGKVRGTFPEDFLYLEYYPDLHSVYSLLPNGQNNIYSVDVLLNRKQQLKMLERRLDSNDLISLITKRTIQLLRFRCQLFSPLVSESLNQRVESTIILNQLRNKLFLNKAKTMLSSNNS